MIRGILISWGLCINSSQGNPKGEERGLQGQDLDISRFLATTSTNTTSWNKMAASTHQREAHSPKRRRCKNPPPSCFNSRDRDTSTLLLKIPFPEKATRQHLAGAFRQTLSDHSCLGVAGGKWAAPASRLYQAMRQGCLSWEVFALDSQK